MNSLAHSAPSIPPANLNLFISRTTGGSSATSSTLVPSLPFTHSAGERERYIQEILGQNPDFKGCSTEQWLALLSERADDPRAESCLLVYLETKFIQAAKKFWRDVQGRGYRGYRSLAYDFNDVNDIIQETHYQSSQPAMEEPFLIKRVKNQLVQKAKAGALHQLGERTIYLDFYQQIKTAILRAKDDTLVRSDYFLLCHTITAKGLAKALKNYPPTSALSEKEVTIALELVGLLKECYLPNHKGKRTKYPPPNQAELTSITNEYNSRIKKMGLDFPPLVVKKVAEYFALSIAAIRQKEPAIATNEYADQIIPQSALEGETTPPIEPSSSSQMDFQAFLDETLGNSEFRHNHATRFIRLFLHYGLGIEVNKIAPIQKVNLGNFRKSCRELVKILWESFAQIGLNLQSTVPLPEKDLGKEVRQNIERYYQEPLVATICTLLANLAREEHLEVLKRCQTSYEEERADKAPALHPLLEEPLREWVRVKIEPENPLPDPLLNLVKEQLVRFIVVMVPVTFKY